jgi:hypothetical protein
MGRPIEEFPPAPEPVNERAYEPEEAIAIVTSVSPGRTGTKDEALAAAPDAIEHLRRLGFELRRISPRVHYPGDHDHPAEVMKRAARGETGSVE